VPYFPGLLSPVGAFFGKIGFSLALRSLAKNLARR